jgi:hypothetical protein
MQVIWQEHERFDSKRPPPTALSESLAQKLRSRGLAEDSVPLLCDNREEKGAARNEGTSIVGHGSEIAVGVSEK